MGEREADQFACCGTEGAKAVKSRLIQWPACPLGPGWCLSQAAARGHVWDLGPTTARICVDIHGPCYPGGGVQVHRSHA